MLDRWTLSFNSVVAPMGRPLCPSPQNFSGLDSWNPSPSSLVG